MQQRARNILANAIFESLFGHPIALKGTAIGFSIKAAIEATKGRHAQHFFAHARVAHRDAQFGRLIVERAAGDQLSLRGADQAQLLRLLKSYAGADLGFKCAQLLVQSILIRDDRQILVANTADGTDVAAQPAGTKAQKTDAKQQHDCPQKIARFLLFGHLS